MKIQNSYFDSLLGFIFFVWWISGVVYAVGWFKLLAVLFPPYAMYLVVEKLMIVNSLV